MWGATDLILSGMNRCPPFLASDVAVKSENCLWAGLEMKMLERQLVLLFGWGPTVLQNWLVVRRKMKHWMVVCTKPKVHELPPHFLFNMLLSGLWKRKIWRSMCFLNALELYMTLHVCSVVTVRTRHLLLNDKTVKKEPMCLQLYKHFELFSND